jgi:hypothetical protein
MPRLTENIIVRADPDLKEQIEVYAKERMLTVSELGRLLFVGLVSERRT